MCVVVFPHFLPTEIINMWIFVKYFMASVVILYYGFSCLQTNCHGLYLPHSAQRRQFSPMMPSDFGKRIGQS